MYKTDKIQRIDKAYVYGATGHVIMQASTVTW